MISFWFRVSIAVTRLLSLPCCWANWKLIFRPRAAKSEEKGALFRESHRVEFRVMIPLQNPTVSSLGYEAAPESVPPEFRVLSLPSLRFLVNYFLV